MDTSQYSTLIALLDTELSKLQFHAHRQSHCVWQEVDRLQSYQDGYLCFINQVGFVGPLGVLPDQDLSTLNQLIRQNQPELKSFLDSLFDFSLQQYTRRYAAILKRQSLLNANLAMDFFQFQGSHTRTLTAMLNLLLPDPVKVLATRPKAHVVPEKCRSYLSTATQLGKNAVLGSHVFYGGQCIDVHIGPVTESRYWMYQDREFQNRLKKRLAVHCGPALQVQLYVRIKTVKRMSLSSHTAKHQLGFGRL